LGLGRERFALREWSPGIGVPQLTAVMDVVKALKGRVAVVADGGLKYSGDITKALAAGARAVMLGSMLAGLLESPGKIIVDHGKKYKVYRGMGSAAVMNKNKSADRYFQAGSKKYVPEGVAGMVPYKGKLFEVIYQIIGGLKAGMGYIGAPNIYEMPKKAEFMRITSATLRESHPHSLSAIKKEANYSSV